MPKSPDRPDTLRAAAHRPETLGLGVRRREVLKAGAAATLGLAAPLHLRAQTSSGNESASGNDSARVQRYRELGKTGLKISDISFGSSRLSSGPDVVRYAVDLGINYFDTAETYRGGSSEEVLGQALEGIRDQVILTSKVKCETDSTPEQLMGALEGSLRRLRTDRVEIYFNHAVNDVDRLRNPAWGEFVEKAKQQGKIRFTGISGHGGRLSDCIEYALESSLVDVMLLAYNFGQDPAFYERFTRSFDFVAIQPKLPELIARAKRAGVGVVAMKTLMGAKLNEMRPYETENGTFAQAAFRWVLSNDDVDALIVSITEKEQIREYLAASGASGVRGEDVSLLESYLALHSTSHCRQGCDSCHPACPEGVSIADALRSRMYAVDYGDPELGRAEYAWAGQPAAACSGCSHQACSGACPFGLRVSELVRDAHRRLA